MTFSKTLKLAIKQIPENHLGDNVSLDQMWQIDIPKKTEQYFYFRVFLYYTNYKLSQTTNWYTANTGLANMRASRALS